jgi:DNA invertase Pin-like site-specific DNA recombinase
VEKAIGYIRTARKEGESTNQSRQRQEQAIRAYCASMGFELVHLIEDAGASGSACLSERPGGAELLRRLVKNEAQHVVVSGLDRLARAVHVFHEQVQNWEARGIKLHAVREDGEASMISSASHAFVWELAGLFGQAQEEAAAADAKRVLA